MSKYLSTIITVIAFLTGCASGPRSPEEWLNFQIADAKASLAKGDDGAATLQIANALESPAGRLRIKELFATTPRAQTAYYASLEMTIFEISTPAAATAAKSKIDNIISAGVLSVSQIDFLRSALDKRVQVGNSNGSISFDLTTNVADFPVLAGEEAKSLMLQRTLDALSRNDRRAQQIDALMAFVKGQGKASLQGKRVETLLPTLGIRRNELEAVGSVFPEYADLRKTEISGRVSLQLKGSDRIFAEDLLQSLRSKIQGIDWEMAQVPKKIHITVERIRADEKISPERTETITYAQGEVNTLAAALLMPRNASYIFEVVSGEAEIEYGYAVMATVDQIVVYDELVRGKVGGKFSRCQNSRIQNVFGGVSSAGFVANADMQRRCGGPKSVSIDDLRRGVLSKVSDSILKVPQIKAIHDLN